MGHGWFQWKAMQRSNSNFKFVILYKIDTKGFQIQQKKLPLAGIKLTTPTIYGQKGRCLLYCDTQTCV